VCCRCQSIRIADEGVRNEGDVGECPHESETSFKKKSKCEIRGIKGSEEGEGEG
jgi:hypothetical protein